MDKKQLFERFIRQNVDGAYRFAYTYTKNKEDAEDVVNESVVKALRALKGLKNPAYIKTWFYKIIVNTSLTHIRRKSKVVSLEVAEQATPAIPDDHARLAFDSLVAGVAEKDRVILVLKYCEDMTLAEIANILGVNENTIKTRLYRTLKALRAELEEELGERD